MEVNSNPLIIDYRLLIIDYYLESASRNYSAGPSGKLGMTNFILFLLFGSFCLVGCLFFGFLLLLLLGFCFL